MGSIDAHVKKVVTKQLGVAEAGIKSEPLLVNSLGANSLGTAELVMALENEFGMEILDEETEKVTTVQQVIDYATTHIRA